MVNDFYDSNIETISSIHNQKVKSWLQLHKKKSRDEQGLYIIEGYKLVSEAIQYEQKIQTIIIDENNSGYYHEIKHTLKGLNKPISITIVSSQVINKLSETKTPQGILAIVKKQQVSLDDTINNGNFFLLIDKIQDPGNLGTIIRSADAAGVDAVFLGSGTVEVYNSKVVRSSMGSVFHLPILAIDLIHLIDKLKEKGVHIIGTSPSANKSYFSINFKESVGIIVGNEANGISEEVIQTVDEMVNIPLLGHAESLNAAMATTLLMYERVRQIQTLEKNL